MSESGRETFGTSQNVGIWGMGMKITSNFTGDFLNDVADPEDKGIYFCEDGIISAMTFS